MYRYKKANVSYYNKWSKKKRCSDNVKAHKGEKAKIKCDRTVSFSGSVSGTIYGISTIGAGGTFSSTVGYSLSFKGPATKYLSYKALYKIETGTRKKYNMNTGKLVSKNKYTVKRVDHGQYELVSL